MTAEVADLEGWVATTAGRHLRRRPGRDTKPEMLLRRALFGLGLRYRLGVRLPGRLTVDIAFPRSRTVVFVDGCFWHGCPEHGTRSFRGPNADLWTRKIARNRERDATARSVAGAEGWHPIRVWECAILRDPEEQAQLIRTVVTGRLAKLDAAWSASSTARSRSDARSGAHRTLRAHGDDDVS